MLSKCPLNKLFLQVVAGDDRRDSLLIRLVFLDISSEIHFELRVLFGVMAENECFSRLDAVTEPGAEVIIVDACL